MFTRFYSTNSQQANAVLEEIIRSIENSDYEALRQLFSSSVISTAENIDSDISALMDFYEGEMTSFYRYGPGSYSTIEGSVYTKEIEASYDVATTEGNYRIALRFCTIDTEHPENIGLRYIYIIKAEDSDLNYAYWGGDVWNVGINIEGTSAE